MAGRSLAGSQFQGLPVYARFCTPDYTGITRLNPGLFGTQKALKFSANNFQHLLLHLLELRQAAHQTILGKLSIRLFVDVEVQVFSKR